MKHKTHLSVLYSIRNLIKSLKMSKKSHSMCNKHSPYACSTCKTFTLKINGMISEEFYSWHFIPRPVLGTLHLWQGL